MPAVRRGGGDHRQAHPGGPRDPRAAYRVHGALREQEAVAAGWGAGAEGVVEVPKVGAKKATSMKALKWRQVHAWRVAQHGLSPRFRRRDFLKAVRRTGGIQAQVMSAAELALWARVDGLTPEAVQAALWQKRTLVKTWAMR